MRREPLKNTKKYFEGIKMLHYNNNKKNDGKAFGKMNSDSQGIDNKFSSSVMMKMIRPRSLSLKYRFDKMSWKRAEMKIKWRC